MAPQAACPSAERRQVPNLPNERVVEATHVRVPDEGHTTHALTQERRCDRGRRPVVPHGTGTYGTPGAGTRTMYVPWRSSCPVPQVRTLRRRLVRVACTYGTEAPRTGQHSRRRMPQSPCSGGPRPGPLVAVPLGVRKRGLAVTRDHARSGPVQRLVERCRCQEGCGHHRQSKRVTTVVIYSKDSRYCKSLLTVLNDCSPYCK